MDYYERNDRKLYFSYKAGSAFGIDSIDLDLLTTNTDWFVVTDVFSGWTSFKKKINTVRCSVSNTSWTNTVKIFYRVNNWVWELLRTFSEATNVITVQNIHQLDDKKAFKEFIDVQFKVELHSDNWDNTPPTLHELMIDYDIIKT